MVMYATQIATTFKFIHEFTYTDIQLVDQANFYHAQTAIGHSHFYSYFFDTKREMYVLPDEGIGYKLKASYTYANVKRKLVLRINSYMKCNSLRETSFSNQLTTETRHIATIIYRLQTTTRNSFAKRCDSPHTFFCYIVAFTEIPKRSLALQLQLAQPKQPSANWVQLLCLIRHSKRLAHSHYKTDVAIAIPSQECMVHFHIVIIARMLAT